MAYDPSRKTITVTEDSDVLLDTGIHFIHVYRQIASQPDASSSIKNDWNTLERWIGCENREIDANDVETIKRAWLGYLAVGYSPSEDLQPVFDQFVRTHDVAQLKVHNPPKHIRSVFDRMLATDEQIERKTQKDLAALRNQLSPVFRKQPDANRPPPAQSTWDSIVKRMGQLSIQKRLFLSFTGSWTIWAFYRTSEYHELLGFELNRWDQDSFMQNLLMPPALIFAIYKLSGWIRNGK